LLLWFTISPIPLQFHLKVLGVLLLASFTFILVYMQIIPTL